MLWISWEPLTAAVAVTGVVPATEFLKESGVQLTQRGFVTVDKVSLREKSYSVDTRDVVNESIGIYRICIAHKHTRTHARTHAHTHTHTNTDA